MDLTDCRAGQGRAGQGRAGQGGPGRGRPGMGRRQVDLDCHAANVPVSPYGSLDMVPEPKSSAPKAER